MTKELVERINALAKKKREQGLTPAEQEEQRRLYGIYLADIRGQVAAQLDNVRVMEPDGSERPLSRKTTIKH